jgi:hypothetical protein
MSDGSINGPLLVPVDLIIRLTAVAGPNRTVHELTAGVLEEWVKRREKRERRKIARKLGRQQVYLTKRRP